MAETVGVVASVVTVIEASNKLVRYIKGVKGASRDIEQLQGELSSLSFVLGRVRDNATTKNSGALKHLGGVDGPLQKCTAELKRLQKQLEPQSGYKRLLIGLRWPLAASETSQFIAWVERQKSLFSLALTADISTMSRMILEDAQATRETVQIIERHAQSTVQYIMAQQQNDLEVERERVLDWLYPEDPNTRHNEIKRKRHESTGQWLLGAPEFRGWVEGGKRRLLWGRGIPGAGKTYLSSTVIDHFRSTAQVERHGVAHIYFSYVEQARQKPLQVLASLVRQLADQIPNLPAKVSELYHLEHKTINPKLTAAKPYSIIQEPYKLSTDKPYKATFDSYYSALLEVSALFTRVFLIFDALDECDQQDQRSELLPLFHRMEKDDIYVFLTSRPHPQDMEGSLCNADTIELSAKDDDITAYIRTKIKANPREKFLNLTPDDVEKIVSGVLHSAKGMFLLVGFHLDYLFQHTTAKQIIDELEQLKFSPTTLKSAYGRAMEEIKRQEERPKELAFAILTWLVKAQRTLTVKELQTAVAVKQGQYELDERELPHPTTLIAVCASLVTIDGENIRLAHLTVQEYLIEEHQGLIYTDADFKLALACTIYLSFETLSNGALTSKEAVEERLALHPFLGYTASEMSFHLKACDYDARLTDMCFKLIRDSGCISSWAQILYYEARRIIGDVYLKEISRTPLHTASTLGHLAIVRSLLEDGAAISAEDNDGFTALHSATSTRIDVLPNISEKTESGLTALHLAATNGHIDVIEFLLSKKADISDQDNNGSTALHFAAQNGHKDVVELLLSKKADISVQDNNGSTALHFAAWHGRKDVVELLLSKKADISVQANNGSTALHWAAENGHIDVVELLLSKKADISVQDNNGSTALHFAAWHGRKDVVELLLSKKADISVQDNDGSTALHFAAWHGRKDVVELLLSKKADISVQANNGSTALHWAAENGHIDVVELLLSKKADISVQDNNGSAALHFAAGYGRKDVVELLLSKKADISVQDNDGSTALHFAAGCGHKDVVELLLGEGADMLARSSHKSTAFLLAAQAGHKDLVQLFLDMGADISSHDNDGDTALHCAVIDGRTDVISFLLEKGASSSTLNNEGQTALDMASSNNHQEIVDLLSEHESSRCNKRTVDLPSIASSGKSQVPEGKVATKETTSPNANSQKQPEPPSSNEIELLPIPPAAPPTPTVPEKAPVAAPGVPQSSRCHRRLVELPSITSQGKSQAPEETVATGEITIPNDNSQKQPEPPLSDEIELLPIPPAAPPTPPVPAKASVVAPEVPQQKTESERAGCLSRISRLWRPQKRN